MLVFARLLAILPLADNLASVLAVAFVAINLPPVARLMSVTLLIFAGLGTVLGKAFHLASRLTKARITIPSPLISYFMVESSVILTLGAIALFGGADNSSTLLATAGVAIFQPLVSSLVGISSVVPALSLVLCLAIRLAVFVEPLSGFAPGSSVGGSVLGATVECLTLVLEWELAGVPFHSLAREISRCPDNQIHI